MHNHEHEITAILPLFISLVTAGLKLFHVYGADCAVLLSISYTAFRFYNDYTTYKNRGKNEQ